MKKKEKVVYKNEGDYGGFTIKKTEKGFLIEPWSRESGAYTGGKFLYRYDDRFTKNTNLNDPWNDYYSYGEMLTEFLGDSKNVKTLKKPWKVQ